MIITGDMSIGQIVREYPATIEVLLHHGLTCFGCPLAQAESLQQGALAHGIDVAVLLQDLNAAVPQEA